mgnify:CR=1 FL=1
MDQVEASRLVEQAQAFEKATRRVIVPKTFGRPGVRAVAA